MTLETWEDHDVIEGDTYRRRQKPTITTTRRTR